MSRSALAAGLALGALALGMMSGDVTAQTFPARPVRLVVGFSTGGPTDVVARLVARDMTASLGQPVIVENRPGANAIIATEAVAEAPPDGHTLLFSSLSFLVNAILVDSKVKYDPFKDFMPVGNAALLPMVVVTSPQTGYATMRDLVAAARAKPGGLSYGASGHAGPSHLAGAMLENMTRTKMISVPFKGNGPALADVIAGRVGFMFYPVVGIAEHVAAKRLVVLSVGSTTRHPDFPNVPTMSEAGFAGLEDTAPWVGVLAPAGTPAPVIERLSMELRNSLARPGTRERMRMLGAVVVADTPAEFAAFLKKDHARWTRIIKAAGIRAD